ITEVFAILAFCGAFFAAAIGFAVMVQGRRSVTHWSFAFGMIVLALESLCEALSADALLPEQIAYWQRWRFFTLGFLPGPWLVFALSYARGDAQKFIRKNWPLLLGAFLLPAVIALLFYRQLLRGVAQGTETDNWSTVLGSPGLALNLLLLLGAVLVLMNLERTFRASVGTMRWRIKFMILGVGVLFAVRAYTTSQVLLFRTVDPSLQGLDSAALLAGSVLILRSLSRAGHFEVNLYPSQSLLHSSFTVLLAGT